MTFQISKTALVLAPHTDDAELGCGGTIASLSDAGVDVHVAVFSTCKESLPKGVPENTLEIEFNRACEVTGVAVQNRHIMDYSVRNFSYARQNILETLVGLRKQLSPDLVLLPSGHDVHQDHQVIHHEGVRAFLKHASIWGYESPWNHQTFDTTHFVRLEKNLMDRKWAALERYESQVKLARDYFSRDFVFGLGKVRGVQANSDYAEAFEIIRSYS